VVAGHKEIVAEGNRLDSVLATIERIVKDRDTIPEQMKILKANGAAKAARLTLLTESLEKDCDGCKHPKDRHISGDGQCLTHTAGVRCQCKAWNVDV
jgi:hypothetical protein